MLGLVENGWALASVDYRLSGEAKFPAQMHDIKAAIRFLRARQSDYGYNSKRIAIAGSSAGGHLVALVGTTNGLQSFVMGATNGGSRLTGTLDEGRIIIGEALGIGQIDAMYQDILRANRERALCPA